MEQPAIAIVPVGKLDDEIISAIRTIVEARFPGRIVRLARPHLRHPDFAYAAGRRQYEAGPLLDRLAALPLAAERVLGVADLDLFAPGLNFIFGLAQMGGRAAIIALARLHPQFWGQPPDPPLFLARSGKEAVHELGHTYGLQHCPIPSCVMHFSNTLAETDFKRDRFCPAHEAQLRAALCPPRLRDTEHRRPSPSPRR